MQVSAPHPSLTILSQPPRSPQLGAEASGIALPSENLLRGRKAVVIEHNGAVYRLQTTKLGKLILTK